MLIYNLFRHITSRSRDRLEELISIHPNRESLFKELEDMCSGLKELKLLFYTIKEVAIENKMPRNQAAKVFGRHSKNYDNKLRYDSTLESILIGSETFTE